MVRDVPPKPALVGSAISGFFGGMWALWASSGLAGAAGVVVAAVGVVLGAAVVVGALLSLVRAPSGGGAGGSMFAGRAYRLIVAAEVVAIVVGNVLLGRSGVPEYVIAWTALVVGVHFLAFGRAFDRSFTVIGAAMMLAAVAGALVGITGVGGADAVLVVTGVPCAIVLIAAGGRRVAEAVTAPRCPGTRRALIRGTRGDPGNAR